MSKNLLVQTDRVLCDLVVSFAVTLCDRTVSLGWTVARLLGAYALVLQLVRQCNNSPSTLKRLCISARSVFVFIACDIPSGFFADVGGMLHVCLPSNAPSLDNVKNRRDE